MNGGIPNGIGLPVLRRYESWVVGTDDGDPFEDHLGRHFTRWGARRRLRRALDVPAALAAHIEVMRLDWDLVMTGEVRRV